MKVFSFDLELNQAKTGAKIIEIGACIGETYTKQVIDQYSCIVNPEEILEPTIIALAGLTQDEVNAGTNIVNAYNGMVAMVNQHECMRTPIVWGCGDGFALKRELPIEVKWMFGRRELDVKAVFQAYLLAIDDKVSQSGLAKSLRKLGLNFEGTAHRAKDDAINTFFIFCKLLDVLALGRKEVAKIIAERAKDEK